MNPSSSQLRYLTQCKTKATRDPTTEETIRAQQTGKENPAPASIAGKGAAVLSCAIVADI